MINNTINFFRTETHSGYQVSYKAITKCVHIIDVFEELLKENDPDDVKKIVLRLQRNENQIENTPWY